LNPEQGQYNRLIKKREQARRNLFVALRKKDCRSFWYWERAFDATYRCEVCRSHGARECRLPTTLEDEAPDAVLCWEHAAAWGFCAYCGRPSTIQEGFDFRGDGLCHACRLQLREDCPPGLFPGPFDLALPMEAVK
jgi:hypothetical protein